MGLHIVWKRCVYFRKHAGNGIRAILYGDMSGLAVKISETMNIEVLREKYATQHAIGVVAWMEIDS